MMSPDTNIKIHHKFNYPENNFMQFLLFSIRKIYSELDFPCYLFKQNCISLAELNQSLYSKQTDLDFWRFEKDFNLKFQRFKKRLTILKKNYSNASQNVIFGRIGELVAYISFSRHKKRDFSLFKKMISKKFESGIDLFVIHKMRNNSSFYYHFYEVKCSCTNSIGNSVNKINNWYTYQNFSQKFVMERDAIIENIQNQQCYNKSQKKKN